MCVCVCVHISRSHRKYSKPPPVQLIRRFGEICCNLRTHTRASHGTPTLKFECADAACASPVGLFLFQNKALTDKYSVKHFQTLANSTVYYSTHIGLKIAAQCDIHSLTLAHTQAHAYLEPHYGGSSHQIARAIKTRSHTHTHTHTISQQPFAFLVRNL